MVICSHLYLLFITQIMDNYLQWTHAPTHNMYHMRIRNLYVVNRDGEREQFMFDIGNRFKIACFYLKNSQTSSLFFIYCYFIRKKSFVEKSINGFYSWNKILIFLKRKKFQEIIVAWIPIDKLVQYLVSRIANCPIRGSYGRI